MTIDVQVNANTNPAIQSLDRLGNKIESIQSKFVDSFNGMAVAAGALGATLVGLGAATGAFADQVKDVADANGLALAEVLAFQGALQDSGGKAEQAGQALAKLSNAVNDANNGNIKAVGSFAKLGVTMTDLGSLSQSEIRAKLLTSLSQIPDAMQRNAAATEVFGKSLMGVDLTNLIKQEQAAREEAERYAPSLTAASDAMGRLEGITRQVKIAFAEAFEPLFKLIANIRIDTDLLVVAFRAAGAALLVLTGAAAIRGVLALKDAFLLLNAVAGKNPLIALGSAALTAAAYIGLTKDATEATKELNEQTGKPVANNTSDQSGYNDLLKKQQASISKSSDELKRGFDIARDKYQIDLAGFSLTEEQKNQAAARAKIEQDAAKAKDDAQRAFDALDKYSQATQRAFLDETLKGIDERAAKEKSASDERLATLAKERDLLKQLQSVVSIDANQRKAVFDAQMKFENSRIMGINEEIAAEEKLKAIGNLRAELLSRTGQLSETDKAAAINAISSILDNAENLKNGVSDVGSELKKAFGQAQLSPKALEVLTKNPFGQIIDNGKEAIAVNQFLTQQSRTFGYGWEQAFKAYSREAGNAANQAQALFGSMTKGIEDAFVKFAQTGKLSFTDLLNDITQQLLRSQIKQLLSNLLTPSGAGGGILATLFGGAKKLLGFANGGIIPNNGPVVVGERGPEILSGAGGRMVTPNNQIGGQSVTYNINAVDAASFRQMIARDPSFIHAVAEQGRRTIPGAR